jgi:hypothetical protein
MADQEQKPDKSPEARAKKRYYTSEEQVKGGTEYKKPVEWYMKRYGSDVSKWPYDPKDED